MPRGGERQGNPGTAYGNRSDLNTQKVQAPSGQQYGERKRQEDSQKQMPLPEVSDRVIPMDAPTMRPDEPVTAGVPLGPGAGPEVLNIGADDSGLELRAIYRLYPSEDVRRLIELYDAGF
jgi:hypothetical protein